MATHRGGGRAGGSQVRDRTERGGRSCARERFKRPRVDRQIGSPIQPVNAPRRRRVGGRHFPSRGCGRLVCVTAGAGAAGEAAAASSTPCFGSSCAVTPRVTRSKNSPGGSTGLRPAYGRGSAGSVTLVAITNSRFASEGRIVFLRVSTDSIDYRVGEGIHRGEDLGRRNSKLVAN